MIGIICALDIEAEKLKANIENPVTKQIGRLAFVSGKLVGQDVVIGMAGVGKVNAAICAQTMILKYAPELIVNSGVAGSLSKRLDIGDIAVGTGVVEHDFDTTAVVPPFSAPARRRACTPCPRSWPPATSLSPTPTPRPGW